MKPKLRNNQVRDAMRAALTREPSDLAFTMARRQVDERAAPRQSEGYERHMRDKGRRLAGRRGN